MKIQWLTTGLVSAVLVVGCGDRGSENTQNAGENQGTSAAVEPGTGEQANLQPPAAAPAGVPPQTDNSAASADSSGTRPGTSSRTPAPPARGEAAPRPAAARAETPAPRPTVRVVTLPVGTALPLELTSAVSSETARVETPISARLRRDVDVNGVTVLPAGAVVNGEVVDVERPGRVQGRARLGVRFTSVTVGGERHDLRTNPVTFEGEATKSEDATKIGAGAGIGAAIGGILGGGDGAAKGAAIGGAAGTGAVLATRGRDVTLPAGSDINATLASAAEITVR